MHEFKIRRIKNKNDRLSKILIKKCHHCGRINESKKEVMRCQTCRKSFLPLNYLRKNFHVSDAEFHKLFSSLEDLHEEDLILGIYVIW